MINPYNHKAWGRN